VYQVDHSVRDVVSSFDYFSLSIEKLCVDLSGYEFKFPILQDPLNDIKQNYTLLQIDLF